MSDTMIPSGTTLGMLGGGQLGRFFTKAAKSMGYAVIVLDPDPASPAGRVADQHLQLPYDDPQALEQMATYCAGVTTEFENVPSATLYGLEPKVHVHPSANAVEIAQNRIREKQFMRANGLPCTPFHSVFHPDQIALAFDALGYLSDRFLLKTATQGYDGKGQRSCSNIEQAHAAFTELGGVPCVLEVVIELQRELSIVLARNGNGDVAYFPCAENIHVNGILDISLAPARAPWRECQEAQRLALTLAEALDYVGVLGVEFFVDREGRVLINEIAPRPHNSGHYTLDATITSQFEQQVNAICNRPLGDTTQTSPVAMLNLLGDLWAHGEPDWQNLLPADAALHLYGKDQARPGRKMGHINLLRDDVEQAFDEVVALKKKLVGAPLHSLHTTHA